MTEAKWSSELDGMEKTKQNVQPCWIVVPPTILYYNQTPCLTNRDLPCEWLSERLETEDPCEDKDANVTAFVKAPWRNDTDALSLELWQPHLKNTHYTKKDLSFIITWKAAHSCFFLKWYVTRRNKNSKSDQTILITNNTLYISPLHAEDHEGSLRSRSKSKLSYGGGVKMILLYWWERGQNQLCGLEMEGKKKIYHQLPILVLNVEAQLHLWYDAKDRLTTSHRQKKKKASKR